jgi:hypothetical protein
LTFSLSLFVFGIGGNLEYRSILEDELNELLDDLRLFKVINDSFLSVGIFDGCVCELELEWKRRDFIVDFNKSLGFFGSILYFDTSIRPLLKFIAAVVAM